MRDQRFEDVKAVKWQPVDEFVLEAAVNGHTAAIVTFNRRDFRLAADRLGLDVLLPAEAIRRVA